MRWLGPLLCATAAWLLAGTPLFAASALVAGAGALAAVTSVVAPPQVGEGRALTAVRHLTTGLGAFFLFVWLAMR